MHDDWEQQDPMPCDHVSNSLFSIPVTTYQFIQIEESIRIWWTNKAISCTKHAIASHFNIELDNLSSLSICCQDVFMSCITTSCRYIRWYHTMQFVNLPPPVNPCKGIPSMLQINASLSAFQIKWTSSPANSFGIRSCTWNQCVDYKRIIRSLWKSQGGTSGDATYPRWSKPFSQACRSKLLLYCFVKRYPS